jgi:hypothetical protein
VGVGVVKFSDISVVQGLDKRSALWLCLAGQTVCYVLDGMLMEVHWEHPFHFTDNLGECEVSTMPIHGYFIKETK